MDHIVCKLLLKLYSLFCYACTGLQYKFFVDGEWRHDENLPHVPTNEYGIVNTMSLAVDVPPQIVGSAMAHGSNMEVDNDNFRRVVRLTMIYYLL